MTTYNDPWQDVLDAFPASFRFEIERIYHRRDDWDAMDNEAMALIHARFPEASDAQKKRLCSYAAYVTR